MINLMRLTLLIIAVTISFLQAAIVNGTVSDSSSGTSLEGVRVQLRNGIGTVAMDTTDNSGAFVFQSIDTGSYSIRASLSGYTTKSMNAIVSTDPLTVVIPLVKIITTTLSGKVTDSTSGEALASAVVRLGTGLGGLSRFDTTGADGLYSFDNVFTGTQTLQITFIGYTSKTVDATVSSADPVTANILLTKVFYATISGKITDSTRGEALTGAVIRLGGGAMQGT
jgi:hypothetical protein